MQFFCDSIGNGDSSQAPGLGMADQSKAPQTRRQTHFGDLCGFPRTGVTGHHHHLMIRDESAYFLSLCRDRQLGCIFDLSGNGSNPLLHGVLRFTDSRGQRIQTTSVSISPARMFLKLSNFSAQPMPVKQLTCIQRIPHFFKQGHLGLSIQHLS